MPKLENGHDCFEYAAKDGRVFVRGSSPVAMTRGAYEYIKAAHLGMVTRSGVRLDLKSAWPDAPLRRVESPYAFRHHYNVVSFGYQTPYYTEAEWTRELDWLALHGYDMLMAPVATEAIAARVWKRLGLTDAEAAELSVGPAHLPWLRMGNIRNVDSPLPQEWHADQVALQHFLLKRMRELEMTPVVQGFAGFVPDAIVRIDPTAVLHDTNWNGGFHRDRRPRSILPDSPLFTKITKLRMEEYTREFGPVRHWLVDSFNEMDLPKTDEGQEALLARYGAETIAALSAGNPDVVWVLQGWMFGYQPHIWNPSTVKALLSRVPDDKMIVLDYANDYAKSWPKFEGFYGKPWAYGFVPNMGGKVAYTGNFDLYAKGAAEMLASPARGRIAGFTTEGEGMENNEVLYELLSDVGWRKDPVDADSWIIEYAKSKYGACPDAMVESWKLLRPGTYAHLTPHPSFAWQTLGRGAGSTHRAPDALEGMRRFLGCADTLSASPLFQADALEMAAIFLGTKAEAWFSAADDFLDIGDFETADRCQARGTALLLEADRLLESHPLHRLSRWVELAREHGATPELKKYYESNARRIVTSWGPPVNDYACKIWSGLIRDFYVPRRAAHYEARKAGKGFDRNVWEAGWIAKSGVSSCAPHADPMVAAVRAVDAAAADTPPSVPKSDYRVLGEWTPDVLAESGAIEFPLSVSRVSSPTSVRFTYKSGNHALRIRRVSLVADGREVSVDAHEGVAGAPSRRNVYRVHLPKGSSANNSLILRAEISGDGGTDSRGAIELAVH